MNWYSALADTLDEISRRLARLTDAVTVDWADQHGRDWAERAALLHRELSRQAAAAAELADRIGAAEPPTPTGVRTGGQQPGRSGPRLGGLDGQRVDEERGVRIAELRPAQPG